MPSALVLKLMHAEIQAVEMQSLQINNKQYVTPKHLNCFFILFSQEFLKPMNDLILNLENMAQTDEGKQLIVVMDFLSKNNWPSIYDQITMNNDLNER